MATDKLSDVALRSIKPRDKQFKLSDGGGLFLLVNPNGSRLWRLAYARGQYWDERVAMMQWWADYLDQLRERAKFTPRQDKRKAKRR